jgi:excisionase family DNA binding protein
MCGGDQMSMPKSPKFQKINDQGPDNKVVAPLLNIEEVAEWLRIPKSTLYKLCNDGEIPAAKIGKHWRFNQSLVFDWLKAKSASGKADKE